MYCVRPVENMELVPYIIVKNKKVIRISQQFIDMTEYHLEDIMDKSIEEVFSILRVGPKAAIKNLDEKVDYFLFSKSLEFRLVNIEIINEINEQVFILREISRFEDKHQYLAELCKSNVVGVAVYTVPDMVLIKANQEYLSFFKEPFNKVENSIGRKIGDMIPKWKDLRGPGKYWEKAIRTRETVKVNEYEHIGAKEGVTYLDSIITPIIEDGNVKYIVCNTFDVTEKVVNRKKIQEQMKVISLKNKQMEAIFESIPSGVYVNSKDGTLIQLNEIARKLISDNNNINSLDKKYKNVKCFGADEKQITFEETPSHRALKGEKTQNERIIISYNDKKRILDVSAAPVYDENNNILMSVTSINDVTELVNSEKEVKRKKEQLKAIIDNMSDGVILINKNGRRSALNEASKTYYQLIKNHAKGTNGQFVKYYDIYGKEIKKSNLPSKRILKGEMITDYTMLVEIYRKKVYFCVSGNPVYDDKGNFLFGIMCMKDITEKVKQEKVIKRQQDSVLKAEREKNEALEKAIALKDEFLTMISHEFRTPLNVINSAVQAMHLLCANDLTDQTKKYLDMIKMNTFRQLRLVNNLLELTLVNAGNIKISKKNIDIVRFTEAIIDSANMFLYEKSIDLKFITSHEKLIIGIDDEKYERILLNVLSNAIKFTPNNKGITVKLNASKTHVQIQIIDKGIGIPSDKIDTIFERFGQVDSSLSRQAEGTGIGLSLAKKLVEALGGDISVKSKVGKGSNFIIVLPNKKVLDEQNSKSINNLLDKNFVQVTNIEFSDIYL